MRKLARHFAELLRQPNDNLPKQIVFHALVAGFDIYEPTTDPNAFFTYFVKDPAMQVETKFVGLHAPAVVETKQYPKLRALDGIKQAFDRVNEINIIVTSASRWKDKHSVLKQYMKLSGEPLEKFEKTDGVGDVLWRPIGPDGPIEVETKIRAMTIMELRDLSRFVSQGKRVLLVAGPCGLCHEPKTELVDTILKQKEQLITHLVIDSACARGVLSAVGV